MRYTRGPDRWIATGSKHGAHFSCTLPMWYSTPFLSPQPGWNHIPVWVRPRYPAEERQQ